MALTLVELTGPALYTIMAIHTAPTFIILCAGMLFTVAAGIGNERVSLEAVHCREDITVDRHGSEGPNLSYLFGL